MISNPKMGWCKFKLKDFVCHPSYITEVPIDLLDAFINYYKIGYGLTNLDEEGNNFIFLLSAYNGNIFIIDDENKILDFSNNFLVVNLARELIADIENNLEVWADFMDHSGDDFDTYKQHLNDKLKELKELLNLK